MLVFFIIAWLFLGLCFGYRQGFWNICQGIRTPNGSDSPLLLVAAGNR